MKKRKIELKTCHQILFYKGVIANRLTLKEVENEKYIQIVKRHNELLKECNEKDYIKYVL